MKRCAYILVALMLFNMACSLTGSLGELFNAGASPESEGRCGDGVCDGPENEQKCPEDCSEDAQESREDTSSSKKRNGEFAILYQLTENTITSYDMSGDTCYALNFTRYHDAGLVNADGSGNLPLDLKDNPTSIVTAANDDAYYYISTPVDPVSQMMGMSMFNWDVEGQTLYASDFGTGSPAQFARLPQGAFPGGVAAAPGGQHVLYLSTVQSSPKQSQPGAMMNSSFNPYLNDSSLIIADANGSGAQEVLSQSFNRQLFTSFADYSASGDNLFTIARQGSGFEFVRISLSSGDVAGFSQVFPKFDWAQLNWEEFFPRAEDFAFASFAISPDKKTMIAYKNIFTANMQNVCVTEASHHLWVFDLQGGDVQKFADQPGYVSDSTWHPDGSNFALAIVGNAGCYPDYFDAQIDVFAENGQKQDTLLTEAKSKITNIGWSPDGDGIAYDVYSTDYVGYIKVVDVDSKNVGEVLSTRDLGISVDNKTPLLFLFTGWVDA